jgi:Cu/Ag efflux pump CusA
LDTYPGVGHQLLTYPDKQLRAARAATSRPLTVRVYGRDMAALTEQANQVRQMLSTVHGVMNPTVAASVVEPTIEVEVNLAAAEQRGLKPGDIRRAATTLIAGLPVGSLYQDQKIFDVVVVGVPAAHNNVQSVENLLVDTPAGAQIRLKDVASVQVRPSPTVIEHDRVSRYVDVTAGVSGNLDTVIGSVRDRVRAMQLPYAYHADVFSDESQRRLANRTTLIEVLAVVAVIFLILQAAFRSWRRALLLFLAIPLAGSGAVMAATMVGGIGNLGAMIGLLAVLSIVVRNGIVLIQRFQSLEDKAGLAQRELVLRATKERALPILWSAIVIAAAMAPFVALRGFAGAEVLYPLASVVIGGVITSTLVTLLVLPTVYSHLIVRDNAPRDVQPSVA